MRSLVAPTYVLINGYFKRFLSFAKFVIVIAYVHWFDTMFIIPERRNKAILRRLQYSILCMPAYVASGI